MTIEEVKNLVESDLQSLDSTLQAIALTVASLPPPAVDFHGNPEFGSGPGRQLRVLNDLKHRLEKTRADRYEAVRAINKITGAQ